MHKTKPGVIFYFSRMPSLEMLTPSELGRVFAAAMHYAQTGEEPQLKGRAKFAWGYLKPDIDRDDERYTGVSEMNTWKAQCRVAKERGIEPLSFEAWKQAQEEAEASGQEQAAAATGCPQQPIPVSVSEPVPVSVSATAPVSVSAPVSETAATPMAETNTLSGAGGVSETGGPGGETVRFHPSVRHMIDDGMVDISTPEGYAYAVELNRKMR